MKQHEIESLELVNIGLPRDEGKVYSLLLKRGAMYASSISRISGVSRVMTYRALDSLIAKELVKKIEKKGAITQFFPHHPFGLNKLVEEEKKQVENKQKALESVIGQLSTEYARLTGEPGVRVLVGVSGYTESLKDIESTQSHVCLIRTAKDHDSPQLLSIIREHISRRSKAGMRTRIIAPFLDSYNKHTLEKDKERLVERRYVSKDELQTNAQVAIYGNKVAIVSYQDQYPVVTIIQNDDISQTFYSIFDYMWQQSKQFTDKAIEELLERETT